MTSGASNLNAFGFRRETKGGRGVRVLCLCQDFGIGGAGGGIGRYLVTLGEALRADDKVDFRVACSSGTALNQELRSIGVPTYGIRTIHAFSSPHLRVLDVISAAQLLVILLRFRPDIAHVHIGLYEHWIFRVLGVRIVYTFHGYGSLYSIEHSLRDLAGLAVRRSRMPWGKGSSFRFLVKHVGKLFVRRTFRSFMLHVDDLIIVSNAERTRLIRNGFLPPGIRSEVIPNGLTVAYFREQARRADRQRAREVLGIPPAARIILFAGRLDPARGVMLFVEAFDKIASAMTQSSVVALIAGTGSMASILAERVEESRYSESILVLGHRTDMPVLMSIADLAIFPPASEGFGLGILEAMCAGVPVVATAVGAIPDLLDVPHRAQLLARPGDAHDIAEKAIALLNLSDRERNQISAELRHRANDFDDSKFVKAIRAVYLRRASDSKREER